MTSSICAGRGQDEEGRFVGGHNASRTSLPRWDAGLLRLRLGIGHPRSLNSQQAVADFVLHRPRREEQSLIEEAIDKSLRILPLVCEGKSMSPPCSCTLLSIDAGRRKT